jgi:hypothetical protein
VGFLCDLHGHLCEAEVIGLLAGGTMILRSMRLLETVAVYCMRDNINKFFSQHLVLDGNPFCTYILAGRWDADAKILYVQAAFPCTSTERREDDGSTGDAEGR